MDPFQGSVYESPDSITLDLFGALNVPTGFASPGFGHEDVHSFEMDSLGNHVGSGLPVDHAMQSLQYRMFQFMKDDSPWNPACAGGVGGHAQLSSALFSLPIASAPEFIQFSDTTPLSDSDTNTNGLYSDSGYGTLPHKSAGAPTVYSEVDRSGEACSIVSQLAGKWFCPASSDASSEAAVATAVELLNERPQGRSRGGVNGSAKKPLFCQYCNKTVKLKSELKWVDSPPPSLAG